MIMAENTVNDTNMPARSEQTRTPATRERSRFLSPAVDIYEEAQGLVVVADVPGLTKGDLDISVEDNVLTIHGNMASKREANVISEEFELVDYFRQFTLSDRVDTSQISATLDQGVLTLKLPKAEHAKPKRIAIKTH